MTNEDKYIDLYLAERLADYVDIVCDGDNDDRLDFDAKLIAIELVRRLKIEDQIHQTMRVIGENALD